MVVVMMAFGWWASATFGVGLTSVIMGTPLVPSLYYCTRSLRNDARAYPAKLCALGGPDHAP
jgi:hypothetical protein